MTAPPPAVLAGRYELGPLLGVGGMAHVYRGVDVVLGRAVAVKVFRLDVDGAELARVEQEMRTLARLSHPGLVVVFDAGGFDVDGHGSRPYLVMELVEGPTWEQDLQRPAPTTEVVTRGAELADTLSYVHGEGVVHRDVKPANILLAATGRTKLADFGVALVADTARQTRTGMTIGTAAYLSPEQVLGAEVGPPSDVYALGLVLLEGLTGRREYPGTGTETALARLHRQPTVPDSVPADLRDAVTAMTAREPRDRPTAGEVGHVLRGLAAREVGTAGPPAPQPSPTRVLTARVGASPAPGTRPPDATHAPARRNRRRPAGALALGLLAVAALATAVLALALGGPEPGPSTGPGASPGPASQLERDLAELRKAVTP